MYLAPLGRHACFWTERTNITWYWILGRLTCFVHHRGSLKDKPSDSWHLWGPWICALLIGASCDFSDPHMKRGVGLRLCSVQGALPQRLAGVPLYVLFCARNVILRTKVQRPCLRRPLSPAVIRSHGPSVSNSRYRDGSLAPRCLGRNQISHRVFPMKRFLPSVRKSSRR